MDLASLDLAIQNQIIMLQRPTFPFIKEIKYFTDWYLFSKEYLEDAETQSSWTLFTIKLKKDINKFISLRDKKIIWKQNELLIQDCAGNYVFN